jgi:hypothetical protein
MRVKNERLIRLTAASAKISYEVSGEKGGASAQTEEDVCL